MSVPQKSVDASTSPLVGQVAGMAEAQQRWSLFRKMVRAQIEAGLLGYGKRRQLIRCAGEIGINPFEAAVIMRQVQYRGIGR